MRYFSSENGMGNHSPRNGLTPRLACLAGVIADHEMKEGETDRLQIRQFTSVSG